MWTLFQLAGFVVQNAVLRAGFLSNKTAVEAEQICRFGSQLPHSFFSGDAGGCTPDTFLELLNAGLKMKIGGREAAGPRLDGTGSCGAAAAS